MGNQQPKAPLAWAVAEPAPNCGGVPWPNLLEQLGILKSDEKKFSTIEEAIQYLIQKSPHLQQAGPEWVSHACETGIISFLPVVDYLPQYVKYCKGRLPANEIPSRSEMIDVVRKYTGGAGWHCSTLNFALAVDHADTLEEFGREIRVLKYAIGKMPGWNGPLYRGVNMTELEVKQMVDTKRFFIPSFTSASKNKDKAFGKNVLIKLDAAHASWTLNMTPELSQYHEQEEEVLISCYGAFELVSVDYSKEPWVVCLKALKQKGVNDALSQQVQDETWGCQIC